jgi:hypothetical protein
MPRKAITKEEKHAARQEKHWPNLGGIVVDVKSPLHSNARMLGRKHIDVNEKLSRDEREILSSVEASMLTASHALDQVLHGLNDESHNWFPMCLTSLLAVLRFVRNDLKVPMPRLTRIASRLMGE